jgi:hypothetical protein
MINAESVSNENLVKGGKLLLNSYPFFVSRGTNVGEWLKKKNIFFCRANARRYKKCQKHGKTPAISLYSPYEHTLLPIENGNNLHLSERFQVSP